MSKNIQMTQLQDDGTYEDLYPISAPLYFIYVSGLQDGWTAKATNGDVTVSSTVGNGVAVIVTNATGTFSINGYISDAQVSSSVSVAVSGNEYTYYVTLTLYNFSDLSWEQIESFSDAGIVEQLFNRGDTKTETLSTGEVITIRIEDFNHDTLTSGGTAGMTLGMENCLNTTRQMNTRDTNSGGWSSSAMRTYMTTLLGQMSSDLQSVIKPVNKITQAGNKSSTLVTTSDSLWLFSYTEIGGTATSFSPGGEGVLYPLFVNNTSRIKTVNSSAIFWWLRSPCLGTSEDFCGVGTSGSPTDNYAKYTLGVAVGFCI